MVLVYGHPFMPTYLSTMNYLRSRQFGFIIPLDELASLETDTDYEDLTRIFTRPFSGERLCSFIDEKPLLQRKIMLCLRSRTSAACHSGIR